MTDQFKINDNPECPFPSFFNLTTLDGKNGFKITGNPGGNLGIDVANAGDVNGDGLPDIILGGGPNQVYVIYGSKKGYNKEFPISSLNGSNGFTITHTNDDEEYECNIGSIVRGIGDINGDGVRDIAVSCLTTPNFSRVYVIFGSKTGFPATFSVNDLNGKNGFVINGMRKEDLFGWPVSGGSDVNDDNIADMVATSPGGYASVLFGSKSIFPPAINATSLDGTNGFNILNVGYSWSVTLADDINNDGIGEILVGSYRNSTSEANNGNGFLIFGSRGGFPANFDVNNLNGHNGFTIEGIAKDDWTGIVSARYDVNGDGISDVFIAGNGANGGTGQGYVIFGTKHGNFPEKFYLSSLNGQNGFKITGASTTEQITFVTATKDINGDRIDDIIVGSNLVAQQNTQNMIYVIYGKKSGFPEEISLNSLDGKNGFAIGTLSKQSGCCQLAPLSGTTDIRGKHVGDIIIGDPVANSAYVLFGHSFLQDDEF